MAASTAGPPGFGLTTVAARAILGPLDETGGRAEQVARRLEQAICLGLLRGGERLPAEPQLAAQMRVATVTLREALSGLRQSGLVETRRGRGGGTFVITPSDRSQSGLAARLDALSMQQIRELGDHRLAIVATAADLAAQRALPSEIDGLTYCLDRLKHAETTAQRGRADAQFALEMIAASQSTRLTGEELRLRAELGDLLWWRLTDDEHVARVALRSNLVGALRRRDTFEARLLAGRQVRADTQRLLALRLQSYGASDERDKPNRGQQ